MIRKLWHIYRLGLKELISFRYDYVLGDYGHLFLHGHDHSTIKRYWRAGAQFIRSIRR